MQDLHFGMPFFQQNQYHIECDMQYILWFPSTTYASPLQLSCFCKNILCRSHDDEIIFVVVVIAQLGIDSDNGLVPSRRQAIIGTNNC